MNIGELVVKLGFSADTFKLKEFGKALGELPITAAAAVASLATIEYQLVKIAEEAMNTAVGFQMFTSQTGLSWKELQKWQIVAQQANVSAESVTQSVEALERQMAEIRLGRGNIAPFQLLGIGVNQTAFQALGQLRTRLRGLDRGTATNLIAQMGINPEMIQLLALTDNEFQRLSNTVAGMTGQQEGSFLRAKQSLVQFGLIVKYLGFDLVGHLIDQLMILGDHVRKLQVWLPGLAIAAGALAIAWAPLTAAIVSLLLVLDDLAVYFEGGDSVIGVAIDGIKKFGQALENSISPGTWDKLGKIAAVGGFLMNPVGSIASAATGAISKVVTQHNTINVHSNAPAHDVGKAVKAEIDKGVSDAALQTDNQGY